MTIFQLNNKPKLKWKKINFKKAGLSNSLRWIFIPLFKFIERRKSWSDFQGRLDKIKTLQDLALITSLLRPGPLSSASKTEQLTS